MLKFGALLLTLIFSTPISAQSADLTAAVQKNDAAWCPGQYRTLIALPNSQPACITITGYEPACTPPNWTSGAMGACTTGSGAGALKRWKAMNPTAAAPVMLCNLAGGLANRNAAVYNTWLWEGCISDQTKIPAQIPSTSYLARYGTVSTPVDPKPASSSPTGGSSAADSQMTFTASANACGGASCTFPNNPMTGSQSVSGPDFTAQCQKICSSTSGCNALTVYQGWCNIFSIGAGVGATAPSQSAPLARLIATPTKIATTPTPTPTPTPQPTPSPTPQPTPNPTSGLPTGGGTTGGTTGAPAACPAGKFTSASTCTTAPAGSFAAAGSKLATPCGADKASPEGSASASACLTLNSLTKIQLDALTAAQRASLVGGLTLTQAAALTPDVAAILFSNVIKPLLGNRWTTPADSDKLDSIWKKGDANYPFVLCINSKMIVTRGSECGATMGSDWRYLQ